MSDAAKDNPFAVHRVLRVRYALSKAGWVRLLERLRGMGHRGAVVGPKGSGKTTLLEDLAARLEAAAWRVHWVRLSSDHHAIDAKHARELWRLGRGDALLIDGAEQLGRWEWWILRQRTRRAGALVVTTHRPGRLKTVHRCETSPELLRDIVRQLGQELDWVCACELHARHDGNIREALRELYDTWAARGNARAAGGE